MNYNKLQLSFFVLFIMTVLQFVVAALIMHNTLITVLSLIAMCLCIAGLFFTMHTKRKKK